MGRCQWSLGRFLNWNLHYCWMLTWLLTIVSILPSSFSPSLRLGDFYFDFISGEPSYLSQNWWLALGSNYVTNNVFSMSFSCQVPNHLQQYFFHSNKPPTYITTALIQITLPSMMVWSLGLFWFLSVWVALWESAWCFQTLLSWSHIERVPSGDGFGSQLACCTRAASRSWEAVKLCLRVKPELKWRNIQFRRQKNVL